MEDFMVLILFSLAMFLGCYLAGAVPLVFTFSERRLRLVTVIGAGLLVGTALAVIIPEGVQSIYSSGLNVAHGHDHDHSLHSEDIRKHMGDGNEAKLSAGVMGSDSLQGQVADNFNAENAPPQDEGSQQLQQKVQRARELQKSADVAKEKEARQIAEEKKAGANTVMKEGKDDVEKTQKLPKTEAEQPLPVATKLRRKRSELEADTLHRQAVIGRQPISDNLKVLRKLPPVSEASLLDIDPHSLIGVALTIGFVLMLLVDQLSQRAYRNSETGSIHRRYNITATIGLVVHAAADGIALGAASSTAHHDVQMIVFVAIMLHKAPAAFGLVTFLLHEGLEKTRIRKHLLIFALSAPLAALATYLGINHGGSIRLQSAHATGLLMLFSAGTFLYVATVHVLPEIVAHSHQSAHSSSAIGTRNSSASHRSGFSCTELFALVVGALFPSLLALGHSH